MQPNIHSSCINHRKVEELYHVVYPLLPGWHSSTPACFNVLLETSRHAKFTMILLGLVDGCGDAESMIMGTHSLSIDI